MMGELSNKPIPIVDPENEGSYGVAANDLMSGSVVIVLAVLVLVVLVFIWLIP